MSLRTAAIISQIVRGLFTPDSRIQIQIINYAQAEHQLFIVLSEVIRIRGGMPQLWMKEVASPVHSEMDV